LIEQLALQGINRCRIARNLFAIGKGAPEPAVEIGDLAGPAVEQERLVAVVRMRAAAEALVEEIY